MAKAYVKYTRSQYIERKSLCTENYKQVQSPLCKFSYHPPRLNHLTKFLQAFISH